MAAYSEFISLLDELVSMLGSFSRNQHCFELIRYMCVLEKKIKTIIGWFLLLVGSFLEPLRFFLPCISDNSNHIAFVENSDFEIQAA